jgi:hypothetical protein
MPSQLGFGGRVFPEGPCSWQGDLAELLSGLQMKVTKLHIPRHMMAMAFCEWLDLVQAARTEVTS